jgi:hypothetical protein
LIREPVCAPGTLSRLQQHQAFAKLADGTCTESPVWLEPTFFDSAPATQPQEPDDLSQAVSKFRERQALGAKSVAGATSFLLHMHRRGHRLLTVPAIVTAAWPLCVPRVSRNEILSRFDQRVAGMEMRADVARTPHSECRRGNGSRRLVARSLAKTEIR